MWPRRRRRGIGIMNAVAPCQSPMKRFNVAASSPTRNPYILRRIDKSKIKLGLLQCGRVVADAESYARQPWQIQQERLQCGRVVADAESKIPGPGECRANGLQCGRVVADAESQPRRGGPWPANPASMWPR